MTDEYNYIRRRGRFTKGQTRGLTVALPRYRGGPENIVQASSAAPVGLEIGFGMGHALIDWAAERPDWQLFGVELYQPGIGALAARLAQLEYANVTIVEVPAQVVVAALPDAVIDEVRIFFPDPWPKKRHHKRRLIQPEFVAELARVVKPGGVVWLATDWEPYAEWMQAVFADNDRFQPQQVATPRDTTKFERRGQRLGHKISDLIYSRA